MYNASRRQGKNNASLTQLSLSSHDFTPSLYHGVRLLRLCMWVQHLFLGLQALEYVCEKVRCLRHRHAVSLCKLLWFGHRSAHEIGNGTRSLLLVEAILCDNGTKSLAMVDVLLDPIFRLC
eukprot:TRINITY_DN15062_c0_g1_i1.p1 TRINITY_DN15062_c0_g1~~TRINITY_DN15062_c0_g1_i1.p1  ORF type:complete len:121 (-),score=3.10 TRINITY_DN15062_c0_g1_i1:36-398(-)